MHPLDDTIAAIASPPGGAARGIVRLSGPAVRRCLESCFRPQPPLNLSEITAPTAVAGLVWLPGFASPLPADLYLWPGRRSYTGQPAAEIHTFGSPPLLDAVLRTLCQAGARPAEPGEFTVRAFLAGRMDLTQAEAVLGVIDAADPQQLETALQQLAGGLARPLHQLREALVDLVADLEAGFDFVDEDHCFVGRAELQERIEAVFRQVAALARQVQRRTDRTTEVRVVLAGRTNTGKSTLFNALVGGRAIVSEQAGTTRDYLTAELPLDGIKCLLIDTAGLEEDEANRQAPDHPSAAAQGMTASERQRAEIELFCLDATRTVDDWERRELARNLRASRIVVLTKCDACRPKEYLPEAVETSSLTGVGLDRLRSWLRECVVKASGSEGSVVAATAVRCRESLRLAEASLAAALELARGTEGDELVAAEVRMALDELGKVAGAVYSEDLLDRIFSRFCVGK
jgi:tRNA modification GTPase